MFHLEYKILFWILVFQTLKSRNSRYPNFPSLIVVTNSLYSPAKNVGYVYPVYPVAATPMPDCR